MNHKFQIGQSVIYKGIVGIISGNGNYMDGRPSYNLVSEEDNELSCTADEKECVLYVGQEIDQSSAISEAYSNSRITIGIVEGITDKHFRDGCH